MKSKKPFSNIFLAGNSYKSSLAKPKPKINPAPIVSSFSIHPQNNEINKSYSSENPKSIYKITFTDQISFPHFHCLSNQSKPTFKNTTFDLNPSLKTRNSDFRYTLYSSRLQPSFFQTKLFSCTPSDPDSGSPNDEAPTPIDAGSSIRKPVSLWPGMYHSPVTNALWEARSNIFEPMSKGPSDGQRELMAKTPSKSRTSVVYKFSTDYVLREQYRNPWNRMRMGKLVEDLDALAGTISFKNGVLQDGIHLSFCSLYY